MKMADATNAVTTNAVTATADAVITTMKGVI